MDVGAVEAVDRESKSRRYDGWDGEADLDRSEDSGGASLYQISQPQESGKGNGERSKWRLEKNGEWRREFELMSGDERGW